MPFTHCMTITPCRSLTFACTLFTHVPLKNPYYYDKKRITITTVREIRTAFSSWTTKQPNEQVTHSKEQLELKPPTIRDLLKQFPKGSQRLYNDYQRYRSITKASNTTLNAWTSHIPRRQQEQQRRLQRDSQKMILPLLGLTLPIIGYVFLSMTLIAPQHCLSRQFLSNQSVHYFAIQEFHTRRRYYTIVAEEYMCWTVAWDWRHYWKDEGLESLNVIKDTDAGPVFGNVHPLLKIARSKFNIQSLPSDQLLHLAQSTTISSPILPYQPKFYIQRKLQSLVDSILSDNIMLLQEHHHTNQCQSLTFEEVLDACLLRGLPIGVLVTEQDMREYLTEYLEMMEQIQHDKGVQCEGLQWLVLYIQPLRYYLSEVAWKPSDHVASAHRT